MLPPSWACHPGGWHGPAQPGREFLNVQAAKPVAGTMPNPGNSGVSAQSNAPGAGMFCVGAPFLSVDAIPATSGADPV